MQPRPLIHRTWTALLAALLLTPAALHAQSPEPEGTAPALAPGTRLLVDQVGSRAPYTVRLVRAASDTLWVRRWSADPAGTDGAFAVALGSVRRLQWSRGKHTHVRRNGGYGLAGGLLVGAALGTIAGASDDGDYFDISPAVGAVVFGVVLGVPAGMVGALTGVVPTERWQDVPLTAAPRAADRVPARSLRSTHTLRPRVGLTRVPVRGAPAARAITLGLTVRPR